MGSAKHKEIKMEVNVLREQCSQYVKELEQLKSEAVQKKEELQRQKCLNDKTMQELYCLQHKFRALEEETELQIDELSDQVQSLQRQRSDLLLTHDREIKKLRLDSSRKDQVFFRKEDQYKGEIDGLKQHIESLQLEHTTALQRVQHESDQALHQLQAACTQKEQALLGKHSAQVDSLSRQVSSLKFESRKATARLGGCD
jgi:hypothetical protein